ncbi:superfamily II DNA or RNA helicase [Ereboglobus sp. PH5-5]|uniref:DEAD/DEAH box helicase n=1 Tax=Ereboglobus sp. PH5-5 TaxID=2940529 RepID=UPI002404F7F8|nr:DEAD/DEAH box helicase [Ereboglobus sp. PH5-5]MDF9833521.1 superfamily II DNA or RNA helicase [Ereboglobus sp. PH5-5]
MQKHAAKRIYSPQSLEFWFEKLEGDWFAVFTDSQLAHGRRIYRDSEIRELELTNKDAIIHRRVEKRDEYAVIEWENGELNIRASTDDTEKARAIAVAGIHEIEELLCDELPPLPAEPSANGNGARAPAPQSSGATTNGKTAPAPSDAPPPRTLVLTFATSHNGLSFEAFWKDPANARAPRAPAFTPDNTASSARPATTRAERAKLIGLAALARKSHFTYNAQTGHYLLSNIIEIPSYLKNTLPAWRRAYEIELAPETEKLLHTAQTLEVSVIATRRNGKKTPGAKTTSNDNDTALDLRWIFKSGERLLTDDEVALVTKRGASPTLLPGVGIVTLPADRLETLENWQRNIAEAETPDGKLPPYLIFSLFNDARLKLTLSPEIETWRRAVTTPAPFTKPLPEILRPYQRHGVEWMHHLCDTGCHGLLADEMGLGKTLQTISLLSVRPANDPSLPTLIVCPASVVPVWQEEFAKFAPHIRIKVLKNGNPFVGNATETNHDAEPEAGIANGKLQTAPPTVSERIVWIASYAQLRKHRARLDTARFGYTILDEGQFIKNPVAKTTQTCFAIRAQHRIVLSGTPLENRQLDLWSIFRFLLPGLLGTRAVFEAALAADREGAFTRLRAQLAPFILRRTKSDVATELPPKVEMELVCPLTDVQRAEYARVCAEGLQRLGDDMDAALRERSFGFLALLTRLRQICCDPDMLPWLNTPLADSGKINLLVEKLAEIISGGHKVVIFSQFVMLLERVHEAIALAYPDLPRYEITGMTKDRLKPVQAFQNAKGAAAMLVSLKAGGTGITLHAADYVFLLDPWWNPAVEAQAVDRVHRIGQSNTVFVYRMVTAGTIEERIQSLKDSKRGLFERIVGGTEGNDLAAHFKTLHELVQLTTAEVVEPEQTPDYVPI